MLKILLDPAAPRDANSNGVRKKPQRRQKPRLQEVQSSAVSEPGVGSLLALFVVRQGSSIGQHVLFVRSLRSAVIHGYARQFNPAN